MKGRKGFFGAGLVNSTPKIPTIARCGACGLYKTCQTPKMEVSGEGRRKVLILAEAPGETEDRRGIQLCGDSGQLLERTLKDLGVAMRKDCWLTNSLICRPPSNRNPTNEEIDHCRPNLVDTLNRLQPNVVIALGSISVKSLLGWLWKEDTGGISQWAGYQIPNRRLNTWICPTFHPAYVLRQQNMKPLEFWFRAHLKAAFRLKSRPWDGTEVEYIDKVKVVHSPTKAAELIEKACATYGPKVPVAFDYETNCLKPETPNARIVSCSICWQGVDGTTLAYPWTSETADATSKMLFGRNPKCASNLKFEERWTRWAFRRSVRNWKHDTMQTAHLLDNRPGITSVKFQSFVLLGQESYDDHIKPYLDSGSADRLNRIEELDLGQLLKYNGLDSLLELEVMYKQQEQLKRRISE